MADFQKVIIELEARTKDAELEVSRLESVVSKLKKSTLEADKNMLQFAKNGLHQAQLNAKAVNNQLKLTQQQMTKTQRSTGYLGTSIAYLASDMGFLAQNPRMGLLAIGNNLSQVAIAMQSAAKEAKSMGAALKIAFVTQGWMIALQLFIAFATQLPNIFKSTTKEVDALNTALSGPKGTVRQIELLDEAIRSSAVGTAQHEVAMKHLKKYGFDPAIHSYEKWLKLKKEELLFDATRQVRLKALTELIEKRDELERKRQEKLEAFKKASKIAVPGASPLNPGQGGASDGAFVAEGQAAKKVEEANKEITKLEEKIKQESADFAKWLEDNNLLEMYVSGGGGSKGKSAFEALQKRLSKQVALLNLSAYESIEAERELAKAEVDNMKITEEQKIILKDFYDQIYDHKQEVRAQKDLERAKKKTEAERLAFDRAVEISARREDILNQIIARAAEERVRLESQSNDRVISAKHSFYRELVGLGRAFAGDSKEWMIAFLLIEKGIAAAELIASSSAKAAQATAASAASDATITAAAAAVPAILPPAIPNPAFPVAAANAVTAIAANKVALGTTLASIGTATTLGLAGIGVSAAGGIVSQLKSGSGGGGSGGGGSRGPSFNIIGQNANNALQTTIEEQTGILQEGKNDQRVVLVTSELEIKQNDQRVAVETATL